MAENLSVILHSAGVANMGLLESVRAMDREALVEIFDLYSPALYNYAIKLCHDPSIADFVVGDVFAKLLDQLSAGNGPSSNLRSYLYEMAYHIVVDEVRYSRRRAPFDVMDGVRYDGYSVAVSLENHVLIDKIMMAIRTNLSEDQRHIVILRFLEGFSLRETAAILGKDVNNVKVIQNRAITALRKVLDHKVWK